jgi:hypothetical protein
MMMLACLCIAELTLDRTGISNSQLCSNDAVAISPLPRIPQLPNLCRQAQLAAFSEAHVEK